MRSWARLQNSFNLTILWAILPIFPEHGIWVGFAQPDWLNIPKWKELKPYNTPKPSSLCLTLSRESLVLQLSLSLTALHVSHDFLSLMPLSVFRDYLLFGTVQFILLYFGYVWCGLLQTIVSVFCHSWLMVVD